MSRPANSELVIGHSFVIRHSSFVLSGEPMNAFDWQFPYPSKRMPVLARNVVAASQPLAAQAGLRMLLAGGNAVDAAVAAAIALTVVEPTSNGIGSDAFAIVWDGGPARKGAGLHGLNASGRSPAAWTREHFETGRQECLPHLRTMPVRGWDAVTVPGAVSAWVELSTRFGKLPFAELFAPAIDYARGGFLVSPVTAAAWKSAASILKDFPDFARDFMPGGRAPIAGERFVFEDQARTLERIAATKGEAFYRGDLAERIAAHAKATGGLMTADDLASHRADWVEPISVDYRGCRLHEIPPNGQGLAALMALGILSNFHLKDFPVDSADSLHLQIEAMKLAFADVHRCVSDPATMDCAVADLLDFRYLARRSKHILPKKAGKPAHGAPREGGTVYLAAADASGMMVSFIQSNYMGFGSGIVVPGTGISLQNRGHGFTLEPGHPNEVGPRKRPYHTIIPAFLTRDGKPVMSFGVMGGPMQPQGHVQMIVRILDYGQNPQAAADAPRWQVMEGLEVALETGTSEKVVEDLASRGHRITADVPGERFGGAQLIWKTDDGYVAASDPRKDGQAAGY
jgi:gamma-glutamyltranspeptidase/glutathione hydrolase